MNLAELNEIARLNGIADVPWRQGLDEVPTQTKLALLSSLGVDLTEGADLEQDLREAQRLSPPVLQAPPHARCFLPGWLAERPAWGVAAQLYELRSNRNWGIGDFADLARLAEIAAQAGADFVGLNPLHALFLANPAHCSPFSPSSRFFLNPLYIAVDKVPHYHAGMVDAARLERLRGLALVDYPAVCAVKLSALRAIWAVAGPGDGFESFCAAGGEALRRHCLFEAISLEMVRAGRGAGWHSWPHSYRDADGAAVAEFAAGNEDGIRFHAWLQYLADRQLADAAQAARDAGMRIGLYLDYAVGEAPDGSAVWSAPQDYLTGVTVGAPPDMFTADGQGWGLAPLSPPRLRETNADAFDRAIRACMRHAGAVRIDHAMTLWQLFMVPAGLRPADGAYMRYPVDQLTQALARASQECRATIIGEDLGIVPDGFRDVMADLSILSYRVGFFEFTPDGLRPAEDFPASALACLATHDLPTLRAWWRGDDVRLREEHGLIDAGAARGQATARGQERWQFVAVLGLEGRVDPAAPELPAEVTTAAHAFIARTPSVLAVARLADLAGDDAATNVPGTSDEYPNWRPKSRVDIEALPHLDGFRHITAAMRGERPRAP